MCCYLLALSKTFMAVEGLFVVLHDLPCIVNIVHRCARPSHNGVCVHSLVVSTSFMAIKGLLAMVCVLITAVEGILIAVCVVKPLHS